MKKLIVANWKMNMTKASGISLVKSLSAKINRSISSSREVVVCPPFTLISEISKILKSSKISLGGQDCSTDSFGAFTGDISSLMLKDLGCKDVIVGHSERREHHNESEKIRKNKLDLALSLGLKVILCVGEKMQERKKGNTIKVITRQLQLSISKKCNNKNTIIAYEPVWSIGSGVTPKDSEICDVHNFIKNKSSQLSIGDKPLMVVYGGSVNPRNSKNILSLQNVDGALVGGASLKLKSFLDIIRS